MEITEKDLPLEQLAHRQSKDKRTVGKKTARLIYHPPQRLEVLYIAPYTIYYSISLAHP